MVVLNTKTGEIILRPRYTEPVDLSWTPLNDALDYIVKKSVSDGVIETGGYSHMITGRSPKITDVKDNRDTHDRNNNQRRNQIEGTTKNCPLIQTVSTNEEEGNSSEIVRELDLEAREARRKQIEDFFTDPVDREIFPLNPPEIPTTRIYRPAEIPTAEESISTMLGKFSAALWDKDFMREVYEYRRLPRPPARGIAPLSYEWLTLNTYSGLMQSTQQEDTGESQVNSNAQQTQNNETEIMDDQGIRESELSSDVEEDENVHRPPWFVRLLCCVTTSHPKKIKHKNGKKNEESKGFLSRMRRVFGRK